MCTAVLLVIHNPSCASALYACSNASNNIIIMSVDIIHVQLHKYTCRGSMRILILHATYIEQRNIYLKLMMICCYNVF